MQREDLLNLIKHITVVRINPELQGSNPKYGWVDGDMDEMCGMPLKVFDIRPEGVTLMHPNGNTYGVHYSIIDVVEENNYFNCVVDGATLGCVPSIDISFIERNCLYDDYNTMKKTFYKSKRVLEFTEGIVQSIQDKCPRVIGVLLSNKKMKRV